MEVRRMLCRRAATVAYWDGYAPWYKLWMEHTRYHNRIVETLTTMVEPGWKVLDIGAGNGVLSLPLCAIGCEVTALEPSTGMRSLLYEEAFKRGIDWITVNERKWEDLSCLDSRDNDLIMACNSLHLTGIGFDRALKKVLEARPKNIFLVTERSPEIKVRWRYDDYPMLFTKSYETESSFVYHNMDEVLEHWSFKKGRTLSAHDVADIRSRLSFAEDRLCIEDTAHVGMYWWKRHADRRIC
jgi:ubiquinone/menaquinone biosynthesis C-methylase UbiE